MQKIKVVHFNNGSGGGTFSVIKNLLKFSTDAAVENHVIYIINKTLMPHFEHAELEGAASQQVFYYSPTWNFYYTCRQLAKLLPANDSVIAAHDWLELGMMSNLGLQNPVVQFVHGNYEYYYELAKKHEPSVDQFITISPVIYSRLCSNLPARKSDIHYCRFPVPSIESIKKDNATLKIIYCVRSLDDDNKQFKMLPLINKNLQSKNVKVEWTIIGNGIEKGEIEKMMGQQDIALFESLRNEEVIQLLPAHDLFILPSLQEGFPVAVVEAMKAGVVPLVTNWEGATQELVIEGETGYYFFTGDANAYASIIASLHDNRSLLNKIGIAGIKKANELFDAAANTKDIEGVIKEAHDKSIKEKKAFKVYGSRLDEEWIPNVFTKTVRDFTGGN